MGTRHDHARLVLSFELVLAAVNQNEGSINQFQDVEFAGLARFDGATCLSSWTAVIVAERK